MFGKKRQSKASKQLDAAAKKHGPPPPAASKKTAYPKPPVGRWTPEVQAMIDAGVPADTIDQARLEYTRGTKDYDAFVEGALAAVGVDAAGTLTTYKGSN